MVDNEDRPQSLRERTREAVREQVRTEALTLFVERGFDQTRTEDIATAVGISPRSFFRYFANKEEVLIGGAMAFGSHFRDAFAARPIDEPVWTSLRRAFDPLVDGMTSNEQSLSAMRVIMGTPSLRAHHFEKNLVWEFELSPAVAGRLPAGDPRRALRARVMTHTALGCLDVALDAWVNAEGEQSLDVVLADVFGLVADL